MNNKFPIQHVLLSRTDSIGDVVLTLPMAGVLRQKLPGIRISFLGRDYTKSVVALSEFVDEFISYDQLEKQSISEQIDFLSKKKIDVVIHVFPRQKISILMKKAGIPISIGTRSRLYHWFHCNQLIKLSRKNSDLHEAQLNLQLLKPFNIDIDLTTESIPSFYGFTKLPDLKSEFAALLNPQKQNVILHVKSRGSAREWGTHRFQELIDLCPSDRFQLFFSGSKEEGELISDLKKANPHVIDLTGKMNLNEFISFINAADGIIAASTGPLHIAAALGKKAVGLFAPMRPIHPGRWKPLGKFATALVISKNCSDCRNGAMCHCIQEITPQEVMKTFSSL